MSATKSTDEAMDIDSDNRQSSEHIVYQKEKNTPPCVHLDVS